MSDYLDPDVGSRASARAAGLQGRYIVSSRHNHLVTDGRVSQGGPGDAFFAGELLLGSLVSCAVGLVLKRTLELGGTDAQVAAQFLRDLDDPTRFKEMTLDFTFTGLDEGQAADAVAYFTSRCPIYNTLHRGGPITIRSHLQDEAKK